MGVHLLVDTYRCTRAGVYLWVRVRGDMWECTCGCIIVGLSARVLTRTYLWVRILGASAWVHVKVPGKIVPF